MLENIRNFTTGAIQRNADIVLEATLPETELAVLRVAHEIWGTDFEAGRAPSDSGRLVLVLSGRGLFHNSLGSFALKSGSLFVLGYEEPCVLECDDEDMEIIILSVTGSHCRQIFLDHLGTICGPVDASMPAVVEETLLLMVRIAERGDANSGMACADLLRAMLRMAHDARRSAPHSSSKAEATFHRCHRYLQANSRELQSAREVAEACDVSFEYMCRLFQQYGTHSPQVFLERARMHRASERLLAMDDTVTKIAEDMGYSTAFSFSRAFKRIYGVSPKSYRAGSSGGKA